MELYLFRSVEYAKLYNCSVYNIENVPLASRTHTVLGASLIVLFIIFEMLYIPCVFAIAKHLKQSCYKFMFAIGITDVIVMWIVGLQSGYFAMTGAVFCSYPNLIYITGAIATSLWVMESVSAILLAINRCIEMSAPSVGAKLYKGKRTWFWLILPILYASYFFIFTKPALFSGIYLAWFFNPHVGYIDDFGTIYHNDHHTVHNITVLVGLVGLYVAFVVVFTMKVPSNQSQSTSRKVFQKASFVQVFVICFLNATAAGIYVYMQFVRINDVIIIIAHYEWLLVHGIPSVIYLLMNRTIRKDCLRMVKKSLNMAQTSTTSKITPTSNADTSLSATAKGDRGNAEVAKDEETDEGF